jgi:hypothetical protein
MASIHDEMANTYQTQNNEMANTQKVVAQVKWLKQKFLRHQMAGTKLEWLTQKLNG